MKIQCILNSSKDNFIKKSLPSTWRKLSILLKFPFPSVCFRVYFYSWFHCYVYVVVQFYPWVDLIFFCFKLIIIHYHTQKQKKIKFKPRIKLNHNIFSHDSTCHDSTLVRWRIAPQYVNGCKDNESSAVGAWDPKEWEKNLAGKESLALKDISVTKLESRRMRFTREPGKRRHQIQKLW